MKEVTLEEALKLWQRHTPLGEGGHLAMSDLQGLASGRDGERLFEHLALCNWCRRRLWRLQRSMGSPVFDYVAPLAADTGLPREATWTTQDGKYRIELRRRAGDPRRGVIVVRVNPPFDLKGKTLVVEDAMGKEILRGRVNSDGLVAAEIEDMSALSLKELVIAEG